VEFPVVNDGKVLQLGGGEPEARLKRWKTGTLNKTMAKQQEAIIKTELMKGRMKSVRGKCLTFADWADVYRFCRK
jgi:hypothetical protein